MTILIVSEFAAKRKVPTSVTDTMLLKNNYYIIKQSGLYHYFRISVLPFIESSPIFRFDKYPPLIKNGVVVLQGKMYKVTLPDLMRGVIRKSREIEKVKNGTESIAATTGRIKRSIDTLSAPNSSGDSLVQHPDEQPISKEDEDNLIQQADFYWDEQVETLLHSIHTEEGGEWEVSSIIQPRPGNEISPIQNSQGDS